MRVIDLINSNEKTAFSFEILPPLKGTGIEKLYETIDTLREFDPKYINITTHRSEYVYKDLGNGLFQRNRLRRRPGTVSVAAAIQNKYNITVVPHILCSGFSREDTEYVLHQLALTTSLPFVHTARRSYRLNGPVKCSDRGDVGGSLPATSRARMLLFLRCFLNK